MKTLIIDGNNLTHRTYWVAKHRVGGVDEDIGNLHVYFTLNAICSYVSQFKPTKTYIAWDEKPDYEVNVRKDLHSDYKNNRSSDNSPHQQNETIKQFLNLLGIQSLFPRELEADDVISYLCSTLPGQKVIVSVDRDFIQLVNNETVLFDPIRKTEFNCNNLKETTGYSDVSSWMTAKCLTGDKSDNVTGIPKFGKVKVQKYLDGNLTLTSEEQVIFERNKELFCLSRYSNMARELDYYNEQIKQDVVGDWKEFIACCKDKEFHNIINKKENWYSLFFLQQKLTSLFA